MKYRQLGNTELKISELSFGTWAIGGSWGQTDDPESLKALETAMDNGVNFFDTADVYGDGHSEELLAKATKGKEDSIHIASKFCRAGDIESLDTYSAQSVREYCENSLRRLKRERLDLYQIHCPPLEILQEGSVFQVLDDLQAEGKIRHYGVSVETVEEGLLCLDNPNVKALQVIFNLFRQKPLETLFPKAAEKGVGIIARVPLASGLLTGKFSNEYTFASDDHRHFNRDGESFNVGETFAGLKFEKGLDLVQQLLWIRKERKTLSSAALRWILDQEEVTTVIPGFKTAAQVQANLEALDVPSFTDEELEKLHTFYTSEVHEHIRGAY
ncbi:aldo/keto reductase [Alkalicoccobacillus murimartini]|uniref:Aryl-alcohol dehydrogenase-like predicted oxidoreductase n=1 Tax=Alkalicoccobacillus murimartini TaxID=171685 RepID=A0ABT9YJM1_9BACI|nr:aldo/keto reductase [Alkalicoccobacillus murimartini]MDQ0207690.1 aryl-alcohol dehydrogenase-like predicted oxidoreductase [Alkalicoccobacillus murimartini]